MMTYEEFKKRADWRRNETDPIGPKPSDLGWYVKGNTRPGVLTHLDPAKDLVDTGLPMDTFSQRMERGRRIQALPDATTDAERRANTRAEQHIADAAIQYDLYKKWRNDWEANKQQESAVTGQQTQGADKINGRKLVGELQKLRQPGQQEATTKSEPAPSKRSKLKLKQRADSPKATPPSTQPAAQQQVTPAGNPAPAPATQASAQPAAPERRQIQVGKNSLVFADPDMFAKELADGETYGDRIDALSGKLKEALSSDKVPVHVPAAGRNAYQAAINDLYSVRNIGVKFGSPLNLDDPQNIADIRTMLQYNPDFANSVVNAIYNASPEAVAMMTPEALANVNKVLPPAQAKKINDAVAYMQQMGKQPAGAQQIQTQAQAPAVQTNTAATNGLVSALQNPGQFEQMPIPGDRSSFRYTIPSNGMSFSSPEEQAAYIESYGEPPTPPDTIRDTGMWTAPANKNMFRYDPEADEETNMEGMISDFLSFALPNMKAYQARHGTNTLPMMGEVLKDDPAVMQQFLDAAENSDMQSKSMMLKAMRDMADSKDPEKYAEFKQQWDSLTEEQKTKITDAFKNSVYTNLKENFFQDLPTAISLWFRMQGWDTVADWAENPWVFYITLAGLLVGGTALVGGALTGGDNDQPIINVGGSANPYYNNEGRW